jgi:hypothetical protein
VFSWRYVLAFKCAVLALQVSIWEKDIARTQAAETRTGYNVMQNKSWQCNTCRAVITLSGLLVGNRVPCPSISILGRSRITDLGARMFICLIKNILSIWAIFDRGSVQMLNTYCLIFHFHAIGDFWKNRKPALSLCKPGNILKHHGATCGIIHG